MARILTIAAGVNIRKGKIGKDGQKIRTTAWSNIYLNSHINHLKQ